MAVPLVLSGDTHHYFTIDRCSALTSRVKGSFPAGQHGFLELSQ